MLTPEEKRIADLFRAKLRTWEEQHPEGRIDRGVRYICAECGCRKSTPIGPHCKPCSGIAMRGKPNVYHPSVTNREKPLYLRPTVPDFTDELLYRGKMDRPR